MLGRFASRFLTVPRQILRRTWQQPSISFRGLRTSFASLRENQTHPEEEDSGEFPVCLTTFLHTWSLDEVTKAMPWSEPEFVKKDPQSIYSNSFLRLSEVQVYGFDFDYTLASYTTPLQTLIYDLARQYMLDELKYPRTLLDLQYDPDFAVRGLYYDTSRGYLLKMDFLYNLQVGAAFYGRRKLELHELQQAYGAGLHVGLRHRNNLRPLNDLFCLPEACLLADIIDHFVMHHIEFEPLYIFEDVSRAINYVHSSALLHRHIMADFPRFLNRAPATAQLLKDLRRDGKQLFLLTNSPYQFIDAGMRYLMDDSAWRELFDVIMTIADKPKWYSTNRPFRKLLTEGDDSGKIDWPKVKKFEPHGVYVHGCLDELHKITGWNGRRVLYFGDQLYTDLVEPGKWRGWRTGAIIRELETEIATQNTPEYRGHLARVLQLERQISQLYSLGAPAAEVEPLKNMRNSLRKRLKEMFNDYFGSVFRTHTNATLFAYNLQRDATIYTSRLENLAAFSNTHCFYPERRFLPHETPVAPSAPPSSESHPSISGPISPVAAEIASREVAESSERAERNVRRVMEGGHVKRGED